MKKRKQRNIPTNDEIRDRSVEMAIGMELVKSDNTMEARKEFTCNNCSQKDHCRYAWDLYNTHGDCLAEK